VIFFPIAFFSLAATTLHGDPKILNLTATCKKTKKACFCPAIAAIGASGAETGHEQPK